MKIIFVFGSNLSGIHGAGAAKYAHQHYGAQYGVGIGPTGRAYALPTKDKNIKTLPIDKIKFHIEKFLEYAEYHPEQLFLLTPIGCGLAGYDRQYMLSVIQEFHIPDNVVFTKHWLDKQHKIVD